MKLTESKDDSTIIEIFVKPNQPKFKITLDGEDIIIFSTQEPVKNKVNREIIKELSKLFHSKVELHSGATSKEKKFAIRNRDKTETERILRETLTNAIRH